MDKILLGLSFLAVATLYCTAFTEEISPNGDNAEYMIIAKSLVERGAVFRLEVPNETPNALASIGLPLMLTPIYKLWGFDIIKMKLLILLLAISISFLLYRFYVRKQGFALALLLSLTAVTSPYLVGNSTDVMTETPYLFWSLITLLIIIKYQDSKLFEWKYYFMVIAAIVMTYLTRAVGIGALGALLIFLAWNVSWIKLFSKEDRRATFASADFKKLFYIMLPLVVGAIGWQIWQQSKGISQAKIFFNTNIAEQFEYNFRSAIHVLPQMLFREETFRFQNFYSSSVLSTLDLKYGVILGLMVLGLVQGLRQKKLIASYTLIIFIIIILASPTPAEMVIIRYLSILLPFIIYFTFIGADMVLSFLNRRFHFLSGTAFVKIGTVLMLAQILFTNMRGNSINITLTTMGNGPAYTDFVDVARWARNNLPDSAYVVSIKPRLFYVLSEKRGTRLSNIQEKYSEEYEQEKLSLFKRLGITHIVLDGISGATRENIFPIVKNNPKMFQTLYIGSMSGTSSVNKIIYENN
ncbi:MAG: glycosyltransferase family 39 protein [Saprospiraceae bacterium]|nr:glycosyltransferase family 39 protein [Saprospiraceae bacterium]